jgi:predicted Holliday junction resolvase-like endonuclease
MDIKIQIIIILLILVIFFFFLWRNSKNKLIDVNFRKSSQSSRYGKMSEQFMPFLKDYPYNPERFRFLGSPVDGVQFEDNKIIFIEFKTAGSQMSNFQRQIAENVWQKRVEFEEHRIE